MDAACDDHSGQLIPVIDRNRCEAKETCRAVCPYGVFTMQALTPQEKRELSFRGRIKALVHGSRQAFASNAIACHACRKCVEACPEQAISLVASGATLSAGDASSATES
jgi:4Fe-4S ferredoxin